MVMVIIKPNEISPQQQTVIWTWKWGSYYYLITKHPEIRCQGNKKINNTDDIPKCLLFSGPCWKVFRDQVGYWFFYRIFSTLPNRCTQSLCNFPRSAPVHWRVSTIERLTKTHTHTHTELIINYCYGRIGYHLLCRVQWISNCIHWIGRRVRCGWSAVSVYKAIK